MVGILAVLHVSLHEITRSEASSFRTYEETRVNRHPTVVSRNVSSVFRAFVMAMYYV